MEWLREIEFEDLLNNDSRLIYEHCGPDVLFKLWERMPGLQLYISTKPLTLAKKRYIRKKYNGSNIKELALKLGVAEHFIYETLKEKG